MSRYGDTNKQALYETLEYERDQYDSFWQFLTDLSSLVAEYIEGREFYEGESE